MAKKKRPSRKKAGAKVGRPTIFTDAMADEICERISAGESLARICQDAHMPSRTCAHRWMHENPEFKNKYDASQVERGEYYGQHVGDVCHRVELGKMDPNAARVAIDGYKWTAARMASKNWGDKSTREHSGPDGQPIQVESKMVLDATSIFSNPELMELADQAADLLYPDDDDPDHT